MEAEQREPQCVRCAQMEQEAETLAAQLIAVCEAKRLQQCKRSIRLIAEQERQFRVPVDNFEVLDVLVVAGHVLAHRSALGEPVFDVRYECEDSRARFLVVLWEDRNFTHEQTQLL